MNWPALFIVCGYLFGFTVTGRLVARWPAVNLHDGADLIGVLSCALLWPLTALWVGGEKALIWFFGGSTP